jgi:hypothetical protein
LVSHPKTPAIVGLQQPKARPDDGQRALTWQQTVMREEYAEIGERGFGLLQGIVSAFHIQPIFLFAIIKESSIMEQLQL